MIACQVFNRIGNSIQGRRKSLCCRVSVPDKPRRLRRTGGTLNQGGGGNGHNYVVMAADSGISRVRVRRQFVYPHVFAVSQK